jgi:hypothetical protein
VAKGLSNTQRTLAALRHSGRTAFMVEKFNPYAGPHGKRIDGLGFIDIIALDPQQKSIIAIQSCGQSFSEHVRKITDSGCTEKVIEWLKCGGMLELWGWRKVKLKRGGKAMRWKPRIIDFYWDGEILFTERK